MQVLDNQGYQPYTPKELLDQLIADLQLYDPSFTFLPQALQGNLLDQASVFLNYPENLISRLLNSFAPSQANEMLFDLLADDRGLRRKGVYKAEVAIRFTGKAGMIIPQGTKIIDPNNEGVVFLTFKETLITSTTGIADVLCYTDNEAFPNIGIGKITKIIDNIPNLTATNIDAPTEPVEKESFEEFRKRVQTRWRNPKMGSVGALLTAIQSIRGVDTRLVSWRPREVEVKTVKYSAYEIIVGGGDPLEIAYAIYKYGGMINKKFLSDPSGSETARTIKQNLKIFSQTIEYQFTRPKKLSLDIKVKLPLVDVQVSNASIQALTLKSMTEYINSVQVGGLINVQSLTEAFMRGFREAGGTALNINSASITFEILANQQALSVDGQGFYPIKFDEYIVLGGYTVEING